MGFQLGTLAAYIEDQDFPLIAQMQATGGLAEVADIQTGIKSSSHLQFLATDVIFVLIEHTSLILVSELTSGFCRCSTLMIHLKYVNCIQIFMQIKMPS